MKHLFKPKRFKEVIVVLALLLGVKLVWVVIELILLPVAGVERTQSELPKALYYRVKLTPKEASGPVSATPVVSKPQGAIKDIQLLAVYHASDITVVTVVYQNKSKVLSGGDEINGFILEGGGNDFATFIRDDQSYRVPLIKTKVSGGGTGTVSPSVVSPSSNTQAQGDIVDTGDHKIVDRSLIDHYTKNMDDIYKNIGIEEIKKGNALDGFKVTFIRRGSMFEKLGLQRGDVLKSINGEELNSYNAAMNMYKNMPDTDNLTLIIQRGDQEMELEYEIN
ncbi:MAG: PDZ domain-containing protein [Campylobacterales bacterium]|nr:PDZ domain-containing protein [Campylobacterales bacterium]